MGCSVNPLLQYGPYREVEGVKVWRTRWPLFGRNYPRKIGLAPLLCGFSLVSWGRILLEYPLVVPKCDCAQGFKTFSRIDSRTDWLIFTPWGINIKGVRPVAVTPAHTITEAGFCVLETRKVDSGKVLLSVAKILWFCLFRTCWTVNNFSSEKRICLCRPLVKRESMALHLSNLLLLFLAVRSCLFFILYAFIPNRYKQASASIPCLSLFQWPFFRYFGRDFV